MRQLPQKKNGTVLLRPFFFVERQVFNFCFFQRDVMASNLSALNAIGLVEQKTASIRLVKNGPEYRFWRTTSVNWKRVSRTFRTRKYHGGNFVVFHKRQPPQL